METLRIQKILLFTFTIVLLIGIVPALSQAATQVAKHVGSDTAENDWFGFSVAVSGDTEVVGARSNDISGAAYGDPRLILFL